MNKEPETYEELIRKKRCIELTKYYSLTMEDLEKIYNYLTINPDGKIVGGIKNITFEKCGFRS